MATKQPAAQPSGEAQAAAQNSDPSFVIEKLYVKDMSLEIPNAPQVFTQREVPQIGIEIGNYSAVLEEGIYEVALRVTVTAKVGESTVFLIEVQQAGIFRVQNVPDEHIEPILAITCPNILFPYAREVVSDISIRAGFPPVTLSPVNFEAIYAHQKEQEAQQAQAKH
ncbi:MAG: protein-export chaperone SecB [Methylophilaceae bacterium]|jgi:preprotein translocase subunit SecB